MLKWVAASKSWQIGFVHEEIHWFLGKEKEMGDFTLSALNL